MILAEIETVVMEIIKGIVIAIEVRIEREVVTEIKIEIEVEIEIEARIVIETEIAEIDVIGMIEILIVTVQVVMTTVIAEEGIVMNIVVIGRVVGEGK